MRFPPMVLAAAWLLVGAVAAWPAEKPRPLMRDFMGLNGHTVQFKPELYAPVAKTIRDYHPLKWDVGDDTSYPTTFPSARNRVDWSKVYGSWKKSGLRVNASVMFDDLAAADWKDLARDASVYGEAFARAFGPSSTALVESAEIGNEPGKYSDDDYRKLFEAMAGGLRKGDPKLKIATCAANLGPSGRYSKSVDCLKGLESLYDVVNIHIYAEIQGWPTWRRGAPEDPQTKFIEHLRNVLDWRAEHAPDKEVWLTEFGWDASTKPAPATGTFAKWEGSTELQQARWIVRAWMIAAGLGVDRAYLFFFNDDDAPQVHGSSGLTRKFIPKPAYYAASWLQVSLGDYRFSSVQSGEAIRVYEFTHESGDGRRILAVWQAEDREAAATCSIKSKAVSSKTRVAKAERMPLTADGAKAVAANLENGDSITIPADGSPVLVWLQDES